MQQDDKKLFIEHLEDMRMLLAYCFVTVFIISGITFFLSKQLFDIVFYPARDLFFAGETFPGTSSSLLFQSLHPSEVFLTSIKISILAGMLVSSPLLIFLLWNYIKPVFNRAGVSKIKIVIIVFFGLFISGILFAYYVVIPLVLRFLFRFSVNYGIRPSWTLANYTSFVVNMLFVFGISFEFPLITIISVKTGLVDVEKISRYRKYVFVIIFILSAVLTPPDVFSQLILSVPLVILFEASIWISKFILPRLNKK